MILYTARLVSKVVNVEAIFLGHTYSRSSNESKIKGVNPLEVGGRELIMQRNGEDNKRINEQEAALHRRSNARASLIDCGWCFLLLRLHRTNKQLFSHLLTRVSFSRSLLAAAYRSPSHHSVRVHKYGIRHSATFFLCLFLLLSGRRRRRHRARVHLVILLSQMRVRCSSYVRDIRSAHTRFYLFIADYCVFEIIRVIEVIIYLLCNDKLIRDY